MSCVCLRCGGGSPVESILGSASELRKIYVLLDRRVLWAVCAWDWVYFLSTLLATHLSCASARWTLSTPPWMTDAGALPRSCATVACLIDAILLWIRQFCSLPREPLVPRRRRTEVGGSRERSDVIRQVNFNSSKRIQMASGIPLTCAAACSDLGGLMNIGRWSSICCLRGLRGEIVGEFGMRIYHSTPLKSTYSYNCKVWAGWKWRMLTMSIQSG